MGYCSACQRQWEEAPCKLDKHIDYWRVEAQTLRRELVSVQKVLHASFERLRQIQNSYNAVRCQKCGDVMQMVYVDPVGGSDKDPA